MVHAGTFSASRNKKENSGTASTASDSSARASYTIKKPLTKLGQMAETLTIKLKVNNKI